jgi:hypothetical protein
VTDSACGSKEFDLPLSRFPLRGQAGVGGFPPRRKHVARQPTPLARTAQAAPPTRGLRSLVHPPLRWRASAALPGFAPGRSFLPTPPNKVAERKSPCQAPAAWLTMILSCVRFVGRF